MSLYADEERTTGFLRKNDREYLENPEGYGEDHASPRQTRYNRKETIKKRLAHAFVDMAMLTDEVDNELRADLLEGADEELENAKEQLTDMDTAVPETISVLYELVEDVRGESFEDAVAAGVTEAARRQRPGRDEYVLTGSGVTINPPETIDIDGVREKVENKQYFDLSRAELLYVVYSDEYDHDLDAVGSAQAALDPEDKPDAAEAGFYGDISRGAVLGVRTENLREDSWRNSERSEDAKEDE